MTLFSLLPVLLVATYTGVESQEKIWNVAIGHDYGAYHYIDSNGFVTGFFRDVVREACAAANMDCRTIWAPYTDCYESLAGQHGRGTKGLFGQWFDACEGWAETVTRIQMFSFSKPYMPVTPGVFGVLANDNSFDPTKLSGKKIAFVDGWANDEKCIARKTGTTLEKKYVFHTPTSQAMMQLLLDGQVDAIFSSLVWGLEPRIKTLQQEYNCVINGAAMMTRKDSGFNAIFNTGMERIMTNGVFSKMCIKASQDHAHKGNVTCM